MSEQLEQRLRSVEDRLEILNLLAGGAFSADVGSAAYQRDMYSEDAVMDRGENKGEMRGREALVEIIGKGDHAAAIDAGMAHVAGLPHISVDGDQAVATGYIQILIPNVDGPEVELAEHGFASGLLVWRLTANRWELERTPSGWRICRRTIRPVASKAALGLLRAAVEPPVGLSDRV